MMDVKCGLRIVDEGDEQVGVVRQDISKNVVLDDGWGWINVEELFNHKEYIKFYEWNDDKDDMIFSCNTTSHTKIELDMAQEIINLRGLDLTDDNIRLIMEEFVEEE